MIYRVCPIEASYEIHYEDQVIDIQGDIVKGGTLLSTRLWPEATELDPVIVTRTPQVSASGEIVMEICSTVSHKTGMWRLTQEGVDNYR